MKSLTDSKSETNDKTTETNNHSNRNITKSINYTDLPKLGNHYACYKIKAQLLTSGNDGSCIETDQLTVSEIGKKLNEIIKHEFGCGKSQLENTKELRQNTSKFDVNRNFMKDKKEKDNSTQRFKNVCGSSEHNFSRQSQNMRSVVEIDLTQFEDSDYFEVKKPSSSNKMNSGKPYPNVSNTKFEKTVYGHSEVVVPNTPPSKERQMMNRRLGGYNDSHLQARKSSESSGDVRKADVNSFYRTSPVGALESNAKSKHPYGNKDSSMFSKSGSQREDRRMSFENTLNKRSDISKAKVFYGKNNRETYGKATKTTGKSFCASKVKTQFDSLGNKARNGQWGQAEILGKFSKVNKGNTGKNNKQTHSQSRNMVGTFESKDISKTNIIAKTTSNLETAHCEIVNDTNCGLGSDEDLFGSDDELDELLAKSFVDDLDNDGHLSTQGDSNESKRIENNLIDDDGGMEDLFDNLDNDLDDATLVACCDDAMSPTIPISGSGHSSRLSGPSRGVKRKLNIPDAQSKVRRSKNDNVAFLPDVGKSCNDDDEMIKECPFCSKNFHSG